jgi:hypothetical protein
MARLFPQLDASALRNLPSQAEAKFYEACRDQLRPDLLVIHSLALIRLSGNGSRQDGEADFVIFDPSHGILVVEVKGGGIDWSSVGRRGAHTIKDPFRQATTQKHTLIEYLRSDPRARHLNVPRILFGHAVAFPDVGDISRMRLPAAPAAIVAGTPDLLNLRRWLDRAFDYWAGDGTSKDQLGQAAMPAIEKIFCSPIHARPLLSNMLAQEETRRIELTRQQSRLLRALGMRQRAMICGGAGTGKTILALERAKETATAGKRTLLLCYNKPLSEYLKVGALGVTGLDAMTFHQLCDWRIRACRTEYGRDLLAEARREYPGSDEFDVQYPYALALSVELAPLRYEAIIVDEAQDFLLDFWLPLEMLLADTASGLLYAFLDHNQALYPRAARPPIQEAPFLLTINCRNTRVIHEAAYKYYEGIPTDHPDIDGGPIEALSAASVGAQATRIASRITSLIADEKVAANDIVVLVVKDSKQPLYRALQEKALPHGVTWALETHRNSDTVVVDTASRFKGLEAAVVFLCGFESVASGTCPELLYVALSRAKSRVFLVGSDAAIGACFS